MEDVKDVVGITRYDGNNPDIINEFGKIWHVLYNTEGFYIKDRLGKQVLLSDNHWVMIFVGPQ